MNAISQKQARPYPLPPLGYATPRQQYYIMRLCEWSELSPAVVSSAHLEIFAKAGLAPGTGHVGDSLAVVVQTLSIVAARRLIGVLASHFDACRFGRRTSLMEQVIEAFRYAICPLSICEVTRQLMRDRNDINNRVHELYHTGQLTRSRNAQRVWAYSWAGD